MMMAQKFLTVNTWQLVARGTHLVQIFVIGLLSLRPADRRKLTYHPGQGRHHVGGNGARSSKADERRTGRCCR